MEPELILLLRPDGRLVAKPLDQATPDELERAELVTKHFGEGHPDPEVIRRYLNLRAERLKKRHLRETQELQARHRLEREELVQEFKRADDTARQMVEATRQIGELYKRYPSCQSVGEVIRAAYRDGLLSD